MPGEGASSPRWLSAFFFLALTSVATMVAGVGLSQSLARHQSAGLRANRVNGEELESLARLGTAAQHLNAPANNIFASRDLAGERAALRAAAAQFERELEGGCTAHRAPATCQARLENLRRNGEQMLEEAQQVFEFATSSGFETAGVHMAAMDQQYALLTRELDALRRVVREDYALTLAEEEREVRALLQLETALSWWTIVVALGFAAYGWRLRLEARRIVLQQEKSSDDLARTNSALRTNLQTLHLAQEQLVSSDRLAVIGTLAAGVAHEVNNPLGFLISNLQFLQEAPGATMGDEARAALTEALAGARRVAGIVADLKTLSRGHDAADRANLTKVLDAAVNIARAQLKHRGVVIQTYPPLPAVRGSESKLGQVFLNLVVNAVQACPPDATDHRVTVSTHQEPGFAVVEIADTGVGIPAAVRPRIFDAFFTTKPVGVGTGLGLSICQRIVTELGGSIGVDSVLGRGSTFSVRLPLDEAR